MMNRNMAEKRKKKQFYLLRFYLFFCIRFRLFFIQLNKIIIICVAKFFRRIQFSIQFVIISYTLQGTDIRSECRKKGVKPLLIIDKKKRPRTNPGNKVQDYKSYYLCSNDDGDNI